MLAVVGSGCSLSSQLDNYFGGEKTNRLSAVSIEQNAETTMPADDLAYARAAAAEVLRGGQKDASLPWENPRSGARGTVTPIATTYTQDGRTCRNFLVSYVNGRAESWMQGEACREREGAWEVRSLKPWKRS